MSSLDSLVNGIVDYAGLFPPAGLEMAPVVENYAGYLRSNTRQMLGRLIVPAGRLGEFENAAKSMLPTGLEAIPWRISALLPPVDAGENAFQNAVSGIQQFNARHADAANGLVLVDVVEIRTATTEQILELSRQLPMELSAFLEVPLNDSQRAMIETIGRLGDGYGRSRFFAKIRTGGIEPELIPTSAEVARFLLDCSDWFVTFKATAGLHHPIRGEFNLTYEADSPRGTMHGFLNVFVAACFAFSGVTDSATIESILETTDASKFVFSETGLEWSGRSLSADRIAQLRRRFATSFGSCSFVEPTTELQLV